MIKVRGAMPRKPVHRCSQQIHGREDGYRNEKTCRIKFYVVGGWTLLISLPHWLLRRQQTEIMIDYCPFCGKHLYRDGYIDEQ